MNAIVYHRFSRVEPALKPGGRLLAGVATACLVDRVDTGRKRGNVVMTVEPA